jgi:phytanoyl-CoA hydroxylase
MAGADTFPLPALGPEHLAAWDADGFVRVPGFVAPAGVAALRAAVDEVIAAVLPAMPPEHKFFKNLADPASLKQIQMLHTYCPAVAALAAGPGSCLAAHLLRRPVALQNTQYFSKPPGGAAAPTPPHQDGAYFLLDPPGAAVTLWLALDAVDDANGAVRYVAGSHARGLRRHGPSGVLGFSRAMVDFGAAAEDTRDEAVQPAAPGDLLAHHALTIHRAPGNATQDRPRRAIGMIFYAADAREDAAGKAAYQAALKAALLEEGRIA